MTLFIDNLQPSHFTPEGSSELWGRRETFPPGSRILVTGPSGRGKTSFLFSLAGLTGDYQGAIRWDTQDLRALREEERISWYRGSLGLVFQTLLLFPELTGWENLELRKESGVLFDEGKVRSWARELGLSSRMESPTRQWSQGERQRLALLRTLVQDYQWILLDEPFSHLDKKTAQGAWELLKQRTCELEAGLLLTALDAAPQEQNPAETFFSHRLAL